MTQLRRKGARVGPRLRAEAALLEAEGALSRAAIVQTLRIGRETLRLLRDGPEGERYEGWIALARRRLASGVPRARIIDELVETSEPRRELEPPTPEAAWEGLRIAAASCGRVCSGWNTAYGDESLITCGFLESDGDEIVARVADHIDATDFGPGHPDVGRAIRVLLSACINISAHKRDDLIGNAVCAGHGSPDSFLPWKHKEIAT